MRTSLPSEEIAFGHLAITYDERVLTPRPWTAAQSAWAGELSHNGPPGRLLELCAGVGHIGLLALSTTAAPAVLVDIDPVACDFARANASAAGLSERVEVRERPIDACLEDGEVFTMVIADPPWVPAALTGQFPQDPLLAIDGGADGLDLARACVTTIDRCLHPDGAAVLQIGSVAQADALGDWLADHPALTLAVTDVRTFGSRGVLVCLRRSGD